MRFEKKSVFFNESEVVVNKSKRALFLLGAWEAEAEPTNDPNDWLKQPFLSRGDLRYHVEAGPASYLDFSRP